MGNGMNKVLPGLYVGNFRDSKDQKQLNEHSITHILAIHDNARKLPCNNDKEYLCIIASDSPGQNLTQFFPVCNDFIHMARLKGGAVLIHCLAGMSRSVTVAVVYVMCVTSLGWRDALKAVQGARNVANPNVGFLKQLQEFEKERFHDERKRLRDKYNDTSLEAEDSQMSKELIASYYHYMSVGEMCDGNCHPGVVCPRGLCHTSRSTGIFRRNSREALSNRSNSPLRRQGSSPSTLMTLSPKCSPEPSRNTSPASSPIVGIKMISSTNSLTPPASPCRSIRKLNSPAEASGDSLITRRSRSPVSETPTPPGSPSRNYSYYTDSYDSLVSSPSGSFKRTDSSSRFYCNGKIIHCPSTPPASPNRTPRKRNAQPLTPPLSPLQGSRRYNKDFSQTDNKNNNISIRTSHSTTGSTKSVIKQVLKKNASLKKANWLHYNRDARSLETNIPSGDSNSLRNSVPNTPSSKQIKETGANKGSPSKFCQVVTRLIPQLVALNNSSKSLKKLERPPPKFAANLYVDKDGKASVTPFDEDILDSREARSKNSFSKNISASAKGTDSTKSVVFELCKNIQKLRKDDELSDKKLETGLNTNIIINPIFSMESNFIHDASYNQPPPKPSLTTCSAYLKDDIIYVETCSSQESDKIQVDSSSMKNETPALYEDSLLSNYFVHKKVNAAQIRDDFSLKCGSDADARTHHHINKFETLPLLETHCCPTSSSEITTKISSKISGLSHGSYNELQEKKRRSYVPTIPPKTPVKRPNPRPAHGIPPPVPPRKTYLIKCNQSSPPPVPPRKIQTNIVITSQAVNHLDGHVWH